ncbi:PREDICTED: 60S ribosomal protein L21-like [Branchiostoma belcheri]|uniref:Large ribosomal subunit protein eL21 n=1 Tax=Branchiostoma belcheri TaxID=7741 RepID=A0A6P5AWC3_BRABE|nr:PREDICTED: 60S ribosomal protein L21-like [Branchiostoma belcheri]KAI8510531.1 60S ribosomal protein L21 [Branchiostoma belcheri]
MTNGHGYRRGTRYMFSRKFRARGPIHLSTYLHVYKRGDIVDVKGTGTVQKGMPYKAYHGRTGRIFNVTNHAVGVIVNKRVGNRIIPKRINLRVEHVKHSRSREDFLKRVKKNDELKKKHKETGVYKNLKREPVGPRPGHMVRTANNVPQLVEPIPYEFIA